MIHVSSLNLFTLGRRLAFASWPGRYSAPESGAAPSLVLDFERDEYRALGQSKALSTLTTFTRGSVETGLDASGGAMTFGLDTPVIDWATGRKGIYLNRAEGPRPADQLTVIPGAWFNPAACTVFLEGTLLHLYEAGNRIADFNSGAASRMSILVNGIGKLAMHVWSDQALQSAISLGTTIPTQSAINRPFKICCTAAQDNFGVSLDGQPAPVDTSGVMPALNQFNIGSDFNGMASPKLVLHKLVVFDYALSATAAASFAP